MTTALVSAGLYKPGLTRRQLIQRLEVDVFLDLCYVQLIQRISDQMGADASYDQAKIEVDKRFWEMRPRTKEESRIERANRIRNNVRVLGQALGGS